MFADIKSEDLLIEVLRTASRMPAYVPAKYISTFKQFKLHCIKAFPEWNYTFYDNRCYHGETDFVAFRSFNTIKEKQLLEIYSMINPDDQIDMRINYDWEQLYLVEIAMYPHPVGAIVDYEPVDFNDEFGNPKFELKKRLLEENGWSLHVVKYREFLKDPKGVTQEMVSELKKVVFSLNRCTRPPSKSMALKTRFFKKSTSRKSSKLWRLSFLTTLKNILLTR